VTLLKMISAAAACALWAGLSGVAAAAPQIYPHAAPRPVWVCVIRHHHKVCGLAPPRPEPGGGRPGGIGSDGTERPMPPGSGSGSGPPPPPGGDNQH
jgi:hypothetical protein